jgi:hypothetical protein
VAQSAATVSAAGLFFGASLPVFFEGLGLRVVFPRLLQRLAFALQG